MNAISDSKSLDIFCSIAKESVESGVLKVAKGLSRKQYYSRTSQLLKVGLIKKKKRSLLSYSLWRSDISCPTSR